jgi:hypothetical protein
MTKPTTVLMVLPRLRRKRRPGPSTFSAVAGAEESGWGRL